VCKFSSVLLILDGAKGIDANAACPPLRPIDLHLQVESAIRRSTIMNSMRFRHDINGLRAIAVIAVVLFHFQVPGFGAGYLGVDIFFVISGFLMAAILMRGLDADSGGAGSSCGRFMWHGRVVLFRRCWCSYRSCCS